MPMIRSTTKNRVYTLTGLLSLFFLITASSTHADITEPPSQLIAKIYSATEVRLSWQAPANHNERTSYRIFRDNKRIAKTRETVFTDTLAQPGTVYTYHIVAVNKGETPSSPSNTDTVTTLESSDNDGLRNGSVIRTGILRLADICGSNDIDSIPDENLDTCLDTVIEHYTLQEGLADIRAFVARLRRHENPVLINLGMRLFHSKSLSQNNDTACSSCHHPALSCGGDGLSLPIGVNAAIPDLLGLGRSDGNIIPAVGRHSQHICNSALWTSSMFWDQRVGLQEANRDSTPGLVSTAAIRTPERDVTLQMADEVESTDPHRLLIAQAHFPVTAPAEMGDSSGFESPQSYREHIASKLQQNWSDAFYEAFGSEDIDFMKVARALSAYEAAFLFIDNPFFDYVAGDKSTLNNDEKRGALFFYTGSGCANCHDGVFFTPERTRGPLYPQIGINAVADGNFKNQFRMPSLLNVGITAPYGDKGVFPTLERVIQHYSDVTQSLNDFYHNNETCNLPQFQHLSTEDCDSIAKEGGEFTLALREAQHEASDRGDDAVIRGFTNNEVSYLAAFLRSLTDKKALAGSNEINALIPPRDGGPDGLQLDAIDRDGNPL